MAPGLNIPLKMPTEEFERATEKARSISMTAARHIATQFISANKDVLASSVATTGAVAAQWQGLSLKSAASSLAMKVAWIAAATIAFQSIGSLVAAVKEQTQELMKLFDDATKARVSPEFFQAFMAASREAKVSAGELREAIVHAGDALKPQYEAWTVWENQATLKITAVEKKMVELRELFENGQNFSALQDFRNAADNDGKIRAVLDYFKQLEAIGQRIAGLELIEKMFGEGFVEKLNAGKISIDQIRDNLDKLKDGGDGVWAGSLAAETKEVDRLLGVANDRLQRDLKPQWEGLVSLSNELKSIWTDILNVLSSAIEIFNKVDRAGGEFMNRLMVLIGAPDTKDGGPLARALGMTDIALPAPERRALSRDAGINDIGIGTGASVPLPRRRPDDAPKPEKDDKKDEAETEDAFDKATNAINRQIAALQADAAAVGLSQSAHQTLRVELRLLEAARQSGTEITDKQIETYARLRTEMGAQQALQAAGIKLDAENAEQFIRLSATVNKVTEALEAKRRAFQGVNDSIRFAGDQIVDVIDRASQKGAKFGDIMSDVFRNIGKQALQAAITGEGAFAKLFGMSSSNGGVGGFGGLIAGLFGGGKIGGGAGNAAAAGSVDVLGSAGNYAVPTFMAEGGTLPPGGLAYVGEHGPNPRMIRAGSEPITVTPGEVAGGGGDVHVSITVPIDARGAQQGAADDIMRQVRAEVPALAVNAVRQAISQRRM